MLVKIAIQYLFERYIAANAKQLTVVTTMLSCTRGGILGDLTLEIRHIFKNIKFVILGC